MAGILFGSTPSRSWIGPGRVLDVLAVLSNQGRAKLCKFLSELGDEFSADEVFYWCLRVGIRVDVYVKLCSSQLSHTRRPVGTRRHTTYSFSSVS